jgi:hypothetical protein
VAIEQPEQVLAELTDLRIDARNDRHAYWLPLGLFGLLLCAAAPLYVQPTIICNDTLNCIYSISTGVDSRWLDGLGGGITGLYWAFTLVVGALVTIGWYAWYGRVSGLTTQVRGPVAIWAVGLVVAVVGVFFVFGGLWILGYAFPGRGFLPMFVIGVGLLALSVLERSRLLAIVSSLLCAWAVLVSLYNVENVLFRVLSAFGVPDERMPFATASTVDVLVPGLLLLVTAAAAFWADLSRR